MLTRLQINVATTTATPPIVGEGAPDARIPVFEQDLDLGRDGVHGLARNGLGPPVEDYVHHR